MARFLQQINRVGRKEREMEVLQTINHKKWVEPVWILIPTGQLYEDLFETDEQEFPNIT